MIPFSCSQNGTAAGLLGIQLAVDLAAEKNSEVLLILSEMGIMPSRRRVLSDVIVNDGSSMCKVQSSIDDASDPSSMVFHEDGSFSQIFDTLVSASQLIPHFENLIQSIFNERQDLNSAETLVILPWYSQSFVKAVSMTLPKAVELIFESESQGYSGNNFIPFAIEMFLATAKRKCVCLQASETGGIGYCIFRRLNH